MLALHGEEGPGIADGALDLAAMPDDSRIAQEPRDVGGREARDLGGIEAGEGGAVAAPSGEDGGPAQPRLRAFEHEELEEPAVGADGHPTRDRGTRCQARCGPTDSAGARESAALGIGRGADVIRVAARSRGGGGAAILPLRGPRRVAGTGLHTG